MKLLKQDYLKIISIFNSFFPKKQPVILAFGSRVDGSARDYSDLDLIVKADSMLFSVERLPLVLGFIYNPL